MDGKTKSRFAHLRGDRAEKHVGKITQWKKKPRGGLPCCLPSVCPALYFGCARNWLFALLPSSFYSGTILSFLFLSALSLSTGLSEGVCTTRERKGREGDFAMQTNSPEGRRRLKGESRKESSAAQRERSQTEENEKREMGKEGFFCGCCSRESRKV